MGMLEELAGIIDSDSTALTSGTNLFAGALPVTATAALALFEPAGSGPAWTYQSVLPAWEVRSLQLISRTTQPTNGGTIPDPTVARAMITKAYRRLNLVTNVVIAGSTYLRCEARQSPFQVPNPEDDGRLRFSVNFDVWRRPSTAD